MTTREQERIKLSRATFETSQLLRILPQMGLRLMELDTRRIVLECLNGSVV